MVRSSHSSSRVDPLYSYGCPYLSLDMFAHGLFTEEPSTYSTFVTLLPPSSLHTCRSVLKGQPRKCNKRNQVDYDGGSVNFSYVFRSTLAVPPSRVERSTSKSQYLGYVMVIHSVTQ
jgi:hypothetical protein